MKMMTKDWDQHVVEAEDVARRPGFQDLRDQIIARAGVTTAGRSNRRRRGHRSPYAAARSDGGSSLGAGHFTGDV